MRCNIAIIYTKTGQLDLAIKHGLIEYKNRPNNIDVNNALAWIYFKENNLPKAQEHLRIAMKTGSKDPELLSRASKIELAMGNASQANQLLAMAKKTNPTFMLQ